MLVDLIRDLERAKEFAERVNAKQVWSKLARAQLDSQVNTRGDPPSHLHEEYITP